MVSGTISWIVGNPPDDARSNGHTALPLSTERRSTRSVDDPALGSYPRDNGWNVNHERRRLRKVADLGDRLPGKTRREETPTGGMHYHLPEIGQSLKPEGIRSWSQSFSTL